MELSWRPVVPRPLYIGISGKKRSGKNAFASCLASCLPPGSSVIVSFAEPLKRLAQSCFGLTAEQCYGEDSEKESSTFIDQHYFDHLGLVSGLAKATDTPRNLSARELLQQLGVTMRVLYPGIWTQGVFLRQWPGQIKYVIVSDVRFKDEAEAIRHRRGYLVRIQRDMKSSDDHISETDLDDFQHWIWDWVYKNDWCKSIPAFESLKSLEQNAEKCAEAIMAYADDRLTP